MKIASSAFFRNTLTLFSGSAISQLIALALIPLYTGIYSASEVGVFFYFVAISIIGSSISSLQSSNTVLLAKNKSEICHNTYYSLLINIVLSAVILPILFFAYKWNFPFVRNISSHYILLFPLGIFLVGSQLSLEAFHNSSESYSIISIGRIVRVVTMAIVQVIFYKYGDKALVAGYLAGCLAMNVYFYVRADLRFSSVFLQKALLLEYFKTHRNVFTYNTAIVSIAFVGQHLPILALAFLFGDETAGVFGMALKILATPLSLVSQSFSLVYYKQLSHKFNTGLSIMDLTKKVSRSLIVILVAISLVIALGADFFFKLFDSQWEQGGVFLVIIAPWVLMQSFNTPFTNIFTVLRIQKSIFKFYIILIVQRILAIGLPYFLYTEPRPVLISIVICSFLYYISQYLFLIKKAKVYDLSVADNDIVPDRTVI